MSSGKGLIINVTILDPKPKHTAIIHCKAVHPPAYSSPEKR